MAMGFLYILDPQLLIQSRSPAPSSIYGKIYVGVPPQAAECAGKHRKSLNSKGTSGWEIMNMFDLWQVAIINVFKSVFTLAGVQIRGITVFFLNGHIFFIICRGSYNQSEQREMRKGRCKGWIWFEAIV